MNIGILTESQTFVMIVDNCHLSFAGMPALWLSSYAHLFVQMTFRRSIIDSSICYFAPWAALVTNLFQMRHLMTLKLTGTTI